MTSLTTKAWLFSNDGKLTASRYETATLLSIAAMAFTAVLSQVWPWLASAFEYDRTAIRHLQIWRIATGHFTHWNFDHLCWDLATFVGLSIACARNSLRQTASCILGSTLAISCCLWFLQPEIHQYRGLSGIDSALFALLAVMILRVARQRGETWLSSAATLGLVGFFAKTGYELATGQTLFVDSQSADFIPLASAHIVGGLVGGATGIISAR